MKKICALLLLPCLLLGASGCAALNGKTKYTKTYYDLFDTVTVVSAYDESQKSFDAHCEEVYRLLADYNRLYDIYNEYDGLTNLCTVNRLAGKQEVTVDSEIINLLSFGREVYDMSGGRTNICLGSVLTIWHKCREDARFFNPDDAKLPTMRELKAAGAHTDINDLVIDAKKSTVSFKDSELKLDVGAVAKGYAVEQVCREIEGRIWDSAVISVGGNVRTFGYKNDDGVSPFNIAVESPEGGNEGYLTAVKVNNRAVVTSGDYQRYYTVDGKKYCHIINPDTLMPAEFMQEVSVICDDSAMADAYSTTLFNMPIDEGVKLVNSLDGVEAVWLDCNGKVTRSNNYKDFEN